MPQSRHKMLFFLSIAVAGATKSPSGCVRLPSAGSSSRILRPLPKVETPSEWNWLRQNLTSRVMTQMLPSPCGSCWAFASAGALSDRVKIATGIEFDLSPQGLLDCATDAGSCSGGSHQAAYEFIHETGLTDLTCSPYAAVDENYWAENECADRMCRTCDRFGNCHFLNRTESPRIFASEYGNLTGVDAMKNEIYQRGPIACYMYAHSDDFDAYRGGVITDTTRYDGITHVVVVVGWEQAALSNGTIVDAWIVRNSFGTYWGELGYYRQQIGLDIYNMESNACAWATPDPDSLADLKLRLSPDLSSPL